MNKQSLIICIGICFFFSLGILNCHLENNIISSNTNREQKLKIFLDCDECKLDYLLSHVALVDIVREPQQAQVYILVTERNTASKGKRYDISFDGKGVYEKIDYKIFFTVTQSGTDLELQEKLSKIFSIGLMNYFSGNELIENFTINYESSERINNVIKNSDYWNSWVFNIKLQGGLEAEENYSLVDLESEISAEKITEDWKILNEIKYETEQEEFTDDERLVVNKLINKEFESKIIYSLSDNWSTGLISKINSSTYRNINLSYGFSAAAEYNFLPWKVSSTKYITLGFYSGFYNYKYYEETLFNNTNEILFQYSAILATRFMEEWGSFESKLKFSQFPTLKSKYNIKLESDLSVRIFEGFSVTVELDLESIHDQIYLAKGDASLEELLLKRKQLETTYDVQLSFGVKFTFGSIYNNIVNDRL